MKLLLTKDSFIKVLQIIQPVISSQATSPILLNVLIEADDAGITLKVTDLDITMIVSVEGTVVETGKTTIQAKRIASIVRELPGSQFELESDDKDIISISCGSAEYKVLGMPASGFPTVAELESDNVYTLDRETVKEMFKKVSYAVAVAFEESRKVLNGVLFSIKDSNLTMVATDSRRLALVETELEIPGQIEQRAVIPPKTANQLIHSLDGKGEVKVSVGTNHISFQTENMVLLSKLLEGVYPNYEQVIPSESEHHVTFDREMLLSALKRVSLMTTDDSNSVRFQFTNNQVRISAITHNLGEAHETLAVKYTGKDVKLAFNPEYIIDPIRHLTSDEIFFEMTDDASPGVIKSNIPFIYVIMPLRLEDHVN